MVRKNKNNLSINIKKRKLFFIGIIVILILISIPLINTPKLKATETYLIEKWSGTGKGTVTTGGITYKPLGNWSGEVYYIGNQNYDEIHGEWWDIASNGDTVKGTFGGLRYNNCNVINGTWKVTSPPNIYGQGGTFSGCWPKLSSSHQTDNVRNGEWILTNPPNISASGMYEGTGQWIRH